MLIMLTFLVAIPLIAHGLANLSGVFAPWIQNAAGFQNTAWVFSSGVTFRSGAGRAFSLLWLVSTACLVLAGIGILQHRPGWLPFAVVGCLCSLGVILPWWNVVPPGAKFGAIFDLVVTIILLSPLRSKLLQSLGS